MSLGQELQYAVELARGAGKIVLEQFGHARRLTKTHAAATKEAVTEADRASQRFIVAGVEKRFCQGGGVGGGDEEGGGGWVCGWGPKGGGGGVGSGGGG